MRLRHAAAAALARHRPLRFLVAGLLNTAVGYLLFLGALAVFARPVTALTVATALAILFNFVSVGGYVFRAPDPRRLWRFVVTYGIVYAFNAAGLTILVAAGCPAALAGLGLLVPAAVLSYGLNRCFVFAGAPS